MIAAPVLRAEVQLYVLPVPVDEDLRPAARRRHLLARALCRTVLARHTGVASRDLRFREGPNGRPELSGPADVPPFRFNLSKTTGLIVCAVALDREIGVDVEHADRAPPDPLAVADQFFAPTEIAALRTAPGPLLRERFLRCWTLKESYLKARGLGLSVPLDRFAFDLADDGPPRIHVDPAFSDDPASWHFAELRPTPQHFLALAVRRGQEGTPALVTETIALADLR